VTDDAWPAISTRTVIGTLLNFRGALDRLGTQVNQAPYNTPPRAPVLYIKPRNTWTTDGAVIVLPHDVPAVEVGATLGIVIGRPICRVTRANALEFVTGYTIVNDLTVPHEKVYRPAIRARCRDGFCPMGPATVARERIVNPDSLDIRTYVNGELRQHDNTRNLIRGIAQLLADVTEFMTLSPGDVLLAGVPDAAPLAGPGDHVAVEIDGLGRLENTLASEGAEPFRQTA
jgi:5-oxopent-3-ene-1,2,5-tricarboxylate decarboxylase/2-hydroxyhepta-2,4-diene-1,7-dioate isomerase